MPSTWVPTAELTSIRSAVANLLPHSAIIYDYTEASDGQGGYTMSWVATGTADCRISAKSGNTRAVAGQNTEPFGAFTLTLPHGTNIYVGDRVIIDTVQYLVTFVDDIKAWEAAVRADVDFEVT